MDGRNVYRFSERRWWWGLPFYFLPVAVPAGWQGWPDLFVLSPVIAVMLLAALVAWRAQALGVEIKDDAVIFSGIVRRTSVKLADVVVVEVVRIETFTRTWERILRTSRRTLLPLGTAVALERRLSGRTLAPAVFRAKWLLFRLERTGEFLSALEKRGVPVRREAAGVESS